MLIYSFTVFLVAWSFTGCATSDEKRDNTSRKNASLSLTSAAGQPSEKKATQNPNSNRTTPGAVDQKKLVAEGKALSISLACSGCHSDNGEERSGPSFSGLWGLTRVFEDGSHQTVDAQYLSESILDHNRKIVGGYRPANSLKEQPPLNLGQIDALVEFISDLGPREQMQDNLIASFTELDFDKSIFKIPTPHMSTVSVECGTIKELLGLVVKSRDCGALSHYMLQLRDFNFRRIRSIRSRLDGVLASVDWALHQGNEEVVKFSVSEYERISQEYTNYNFDLVLNILDEIAVHDSGAHQDFLNPWILAGKQAGPIESAAVIKVTKFVNENEIRIQAQREKIAEARKNTKSSNEHVQKNPELEALPPFVRTLAQFKTTKEQEQQVEKLAQSSKQTLMDVGSAQVGESGFIDLLFSAAHESDIRKRRAMLREFRMKSQNELKQLNDIRFKVMKIYSKEQYAHASWGDLMIPVVAVLLKRH